MTRMDMDYFDLAKSIQIQAHKMAKKILAMEGENQLKELMFNNASLLGYIQFTKAKGENENFEKWFEKIENIMSKVAENERQGRKTIKF